MSDGSPSDAWQTYLICECSRGAASRAVPCRCGYLADPGQACGRAPKCTAAVAARVEKARVLQSRRYEGLGLRTNAQAEGELLDRVAAPEPAGAKLLPDAAGAMRLTARGYHRVPKLARTIADLAGSETVMRIHIAEALSYRRMVHTRWLRKKPDGVAFLSRHRRAITWIANFCTIRFGVAAGSQR